MLSICLLNAISESKLKEYNETLTLSKFYQLFEEGSYNVTNDIEFDNISVNSTEIYIGEIVKFRNGSSNFRHALPRVSLSGHSGYKGIGFVKCFGLQSMETDVTFVMYGFNQTAFPEKLQTFSPRGFVVFIHMPRQLVLAGRSVKYVFPERNTNQEYIMTFPLQHFEQLRRRNKRNDPCIPFEENFDQIILDDHLEKVGCKGFAHKSNKSLKLCDTKEKMKGATIDQMMETKKNEKGVYKCSYDDV